MVYETVKLLAAEIKTSVECLVQQFANAGINKTENDFVTQNEKEILLAYFNHKDGIKNIYSGELTLHRKIRSTLNVLTSTGKNKLVNIEIRKKHIYFNKELSEITKTKDTTIFNIKKEIKLKHQQTKKTELEYQQKQDCSIVIENKKNKENKNNVKISKINLNIIDFSNQKYQKNKVFELKHKTEDRKIESKNKKNTEEIRHITVENSNNGNKKNKEYLYTTNFHYVREFKDKNNIKNDTHHIRNKNSKITRQQKKQKYLKQVYREEEHIIFRNKGKYKKNSSLQQNFTKPLMNISRDVVIGEVISIIELANKMAVKGSQVIKTLMKMGVMVTINQIIDQETAQLVAEEMGHKVILRRENELEESILSDRDINKQNTESRAPIVTIMGHVDHGKTSLLDYIRSTKVVCDEAGGITQHIGAYHVKTDKGIITFLDTPGHSAFTAMRARGAKVTDIIVLVVAIDDGVMPQTIEAIQHAKAANVPVIVAINKIDKNYVSFDRIKNELTKHDLIPEDWGGTNQFIGISAKNGTGIDKLLEAILLQAEILELKAVHTGMATGIVIESYLDKGRGPVATILVQEGTLHKGDIILCGLQYGRVRAIRDELGKDILSAGPSIPVEILGLSNIPISGHKFTVVRDEKKAREVAFYRQNKLRELKLADQQKLKLENIFTGIKEGKISEFSIVLKTDVQGTCEAITDSLYKLSTNKVKLKIIGSGVGGITETDATLASASNAIIIGFNVRADNAAKRIIENEHLDLRYYSVIYNLIDEIKHIINGILIPEYKQNLIGFAEVRNIFKSPKLGVIAGCMVSDGIIKRNHQIRVLRNNIVIYEGELESLRRFKDDIPLVSNGMECGIKIKNYNDIKIGDIIEVFEMMEVKNIIS